MHDNLPGLPSDGSENRKETDKGISHQELPDALKPFSPPTVSDPVRNSPFRTSPVETRDCSAHKMENVLKSWVRDEAPSKAFWQRYDQNGRAIPPEEGGLIDYELIMAAKPNPALGLKIAMIGHENPFSSKGGGLMKILQTLPEEFNEYMKHDTSRAVPHEMIRVSPLGMNAETLNLWAATRNAKEIMKGRDAQSFSRVPFNEIPQELIAEVIGTDGESHGCDKIVYHGSCNVEYGLKNEKGMRKNYEVDVFRGLHAQSNTEWILYHHPDFFRADSIPYVYRTNPWPAELVKDPLVEDSSFSVVSAPRVLSHMGYGVEQLLLFTQDWEYEDATITGPANVISGHLKTVAVCPAHHNFYDQERDERQLSKITDNCHPRHFPGYENPEDPRSTIITQSSLLANSPLIMVSEHLVEEAMRVPEKVGAKPALAHIIKNFGAGGIFNGFYEKPRWDPETLEACNAALNGDYTKLSAILEANKAEMYKEMGRYIHERRSLQEADGKVRVIGSLKGETENGGPIIVHNDIPTFVYVGRACVEQKGIDNFLEGLRLVKDKDYRFIMVAPGLTEAGLSEFLKRAKEIVGELDGKLVILTEWVQGKTRECLQKGPDVGTYQSYFEPTGSNSELYMNLTLCLSHATTGQQRLVVHHGTEGKIGTGLHYGLPLMDVETERKFWKDMRADISPEGRQKLEIYQKLAKAAQHGIEEFIRLRTEHKEDFLHMVANLPKFLETLSWDSAIEAYAQTFEAACKR